MKFYACFIYLEHKKAFDKAVWYRDHGYDDQTLWCGAPGKRDHTDPFDRRGEPYAAVWPDRAPGEAPLS